jgi:hypothetical protein
LTVFVPEYWGGWWDVNEEGNFTNVNTGMLLPKEVGDTKWYLGEPNGDTLENCVIVYPDRNAWNDDSCSKKLCGFCEWERAPDLQIRGELLI